MTNGAVNQRARLAIALTVVATLCAPAVAGAQIRQVSTKSDNKQTVNFTMGYFALKGLDSRVDDDVLFNELQSAQPLLFEVKDFPPDFFHAANRRQLRFGIAGVMVRIPAQPPENEQ